MEKIKEKIKKDLSDFIKEKNVEGCSVLRMLLSNVLLKEKEKNYLVRKNNIEAGEVELTDEEIDTVIFSEAKKRKDSISAFEKGNRPDLVEKEKKELLILSKYLPKQMSEEELKIMVKESFEKGKKDFKDLMSDIIPKVKGKADGSMVSKIVKEMLDTA